MCIATSINNSNSFNNSKKAIKFVKVCGQKNSEAPYVYVTQHCLILLALNALWQKRQNKVILTNYIGSGCSQYNWEENRRNPFWHLILALITCLGHKYEWEPFEYRQGYIYVSNPLSRGVNCHVNPLEMCGHLLFVVCLCYFLVWSLYLMLVWAERSVISTVG